MNEEGVGTNFSCPEQNNDNDENSQLTKFKVTYKIKVIDTNRKLCAQRC